MVSWIEVAKDDETPWGDPRLGAYDYIHPTEGTTGGVRSMVGPGGQRFEFQLYSHVGVLIELSSEAFASLGDFPRYLRQLGLGKLRKDHSLPLMPPPDRIWIQSAHDDAVLVTRPPSGEPAFFLLGPLGVSALRMMQMGQIPVLFFVDAVVLPSPTMRKEDRARQAGKAWGGLVTCTDAGSGQPTGAGTAWAYHAANKPEQVLEGADAARRALEEARQTGSPAE